MIPVRHKRSGQPARPATASTEQEPPRPRLHAPGWPQSCTTIESTRSDPGGAGRRIVRAAAAGSRRRDDRVGAVADTTAKLAQANINLTAAAATGAGAGRFGMIVWVAASDYERAAETLGASRRRRAALRLRQAKAGRRPRAEPLRRAATAKRNSLMEASCAAGCWLAHLLAHTAETPCKSGSTESS
jgi:predicted amino acid-binding ACT domain protein